MIKLHRIIDGYEQESRIAIPKRDIQQVHEGRGGITIVTTPIGKIAVEETYEQVVDAYEGDGDDIQV